MVIEVKEMLDFLLEKFNEEQVAEAVDVSTRSLNNYRNGGNPHKATKQKIEEVYKAVLDGGSLTAKKAPSFETEQGSVNKAIFQVKAQNMVILSALAEILAKQNNQLASITLKHLESAVNDNYREIERGLKSG